MARLYKTYLLLWVASTQYKILNMTKNFSATDIAGAIIQNIGDQMHSVYTTFPWLQIKFSSIQVVTRSLA
jgi:hypothetical protein